MPIFKIKGVNLSDFKYCKWIYNELNKDMALWEIPMDLTMLLM